MAGPKHSPNKKADIITLGCRLNAFESEVMRRNADTAGLKDAVIINTCAVTTEAEKQARQTIRKAKRDNPDAKIIVTGCAAQLDPTRFARMEEVDRVLGNKEKMEADAFVEKADEAEIVVSDIMEVRETAGHLLGGSLSDFGGRSRAFVQVQQGCDHRCTFCIIPFARGPNRSLPFTAIQAQVQKLVDGGYNEVVLTGVDVSSYGEDNPDGLTLGAMTRKLLDAVPDLPRLRITSLDPANMDDDLFDLLATHPRFMPHLHLSLQACDDMVLKRMKRRHSRRDAEIICQRARDARPDVVLGADLIAGFPTETEEQFQNTLSSVKDFDLTYLHVFPYSPRPGTPAARMPEVPAKIRKERAALIRAAGDAAEKELLKKLTGQKATVLVEKGNKGHSEHFAEVSLAETFDPGTLVRVTLTLSEDGTLVGDPV